MPRIKALALALLLLAGGASAEPDPFTASLTKNRFLEAEYSQASKNRFYVVIDLDRMEIQLKARGSVFRTWPILNYQQIGGELPIEVMALQKRTYASEALRVRIKPADGDKEEVLEPSPVKKMKLAELAKNAPNDPNAPQNVTAPKWDAMELKDMPTDYFLTFPNDLHVNVDSEEPPKDDSLSAKWGKFVERFKHTYEIYKKRKEPTGKGTTVNLKLKPDDAKAFYWALGDSMNVIFWAAPK